MQLHPALRFDVIRNFATDLQHCAISACGSSPCLEDVKTLGLECILDNDWTLIRPVIYELLDPMYIPALSQLRRLPAKGKIAIRLRCVWYLFGLIVRHDVLQPVPDVSAFLWDRLWLWVQLIDENYASIPELALHHPSKSVVLFTCIAVIGSLSDHDPTHEIIIRTPGTISLFTRAWDLHTSVEHPILLYNGVVASDHFWTTISPIIAHCPDDLVEACGGSFDDVARFIVQGLRAKLGMQASTEDRPSLTLAPFLILLKSVLHSSGPNFQNDLVNHGVVGVLADVLTVLMGDSTGPPYTVMVIAIEVIILFFRFPGQLSTAIDKGLLQAMLVFARKDKSEVLASLALECGIDPDHLLAL
ncbi:hypothetical protein GGX14DRAFT_397842 [Mycena pura]|uniref:Uncharacterized protein n=1 Tax=Mycena pura TaxID=153505 RepID=A0AAD6V8C6_9AGAR|nr:hypothetical protein GGX14DRAFT_397842 [Mycena pura]